MCSRCNDLQTDFKWAKFDCLPTNLRIVNVNTAVIWKMEMLKLTFVLTSQIFSVSDYKILPYYVWESYILHTEPHYYLKIWNTFCSPLSLEDWGQLPGKVPINSLIEYPKYSLQSLKLRMWATGKNNFTVRCVFWFFMQPNRESTIIIKLHHE